MISPDARLADLLFCVVMLCCCSEIGFNFSIYLLKTTPLLSSTTSPLCRGDPTPGPGYIDNYCLSSFSKPLNEFFEYLSFDSHAVRRLAVNPIARHVVVIFQNSKPVYCYDKVSKELISAFEHNYLLWLLIIVFLFQQE
jgi:hypothetical protein